MVVFLLTGGGSGIGQALAHALATRGKRVMIVGRRKQLLAETAAFSPFINYLCADIATDEGRRQIRSHLQAIRSIEGLIHNAGIIEPISPVATIDESSWQRIMATNLHAPLFLTQLLLDKLSEGRVLHLGSGAAYFPVKGWAGYCVSKAALAMLTRCWQLESQSTAFGSVQPGVVDTQMQSLVRKAEFMDKKGRQFYSRLQQEGRLIAPATVALFLCWLLLDVGKEPYCAKEWDIYDRSHHQFWLVAPHRVPDLE
jgi:benzil reductase ((S)-benzoin forming)